MNPLHASKILDLPPGVIPETNELIRAAIQWHFSPQTGSRFWLDRVSTLGFNPLTEIQCLDDLSKFSNVVNELRTVPVEDLIPLGIKNRSELYGVFESGGTTGAPKRIICLREWMEKWLTFSQNQLNIRNIPSGLNWLAIMPDGPHIFGAALRESATRTGGIHFTIDMDPRWVKKCIKDGRSIEAAAYADHLINQARYILRSQNIGVLTTTPPLLVKIAKDDELVELINKNVKLIQWGGAHMDADTRRLLASEVFPRTQMQGGYGSTMVLGGSLERLQPHPENLCVFDPLSPYIMFRVVNPETGLEVELGKRGQVVMNHISKGMFIPNNLERDSAIRIAGHSADAGDAVADVMPLATIDDETVIEGVY